MQKLIAIVGPTASGKSSLAIRLAKKLNGEIISVDSRQVYRGLTIGSGAVTHQEMRGVPHHLLGFRSPSTILGADRFKRLADKKIAEITKRHKLPFLVGGTGFYLKAVTENLEFPRAKPDQKLRQRLAKKSLVELFRLLKKLSPARAKTIDRDNPRRLIRAIEIACLDADDSQISKPARYDYLILGIKPDKDLLKGKIEKRFYAWLRQGFLKEVERLRQAKLSRARFKELGLHYWYAYLYLTKRISYEEFCQKSISAIWHYAKRQLTWFKQEKKIVWIENYRQASTKIRQFLAEK